MHNLPQQRKQPTKKPHKEAVCLLYGFLVGNIKEEIIMYEIEEINGEQRVNSPPWIWIWTKIEKRGDYL